MKKPYRVHGFLHIIFMAAGIIYDSPAGVALGLAEIFMGSDILVTDYIYVGGFGATLVNAGLSGLLAIAALVLAKHEPNGLTFGTLGLTIGLAFFGKNPLNMLPIIAGGFLYAKFAKMPSTNCILRVLLATCLAPAVTQLAHVTDLPFTATAIIGTGFGLTIGFLITPLAIHMESAHKGYNLYNVGFTAGILGMGIFALYNLAGAGFSTLEYWSSGYTPHLMIFLAAVSLYFITCGILGRGEPVHLRTFLDFQADDHDYFKKYRETAYIHMGILGFACFAFMLIVRGEYNGPIIGAILSVVGFGAFGKNLSSAAPLVTGAMLAAATSWVITGTPINNSGFLVAAIFSTCLSPLVKRFGWGWGIAAGFLHLSFAVTVGAFHGGLNLYNNGLAGGLAAMVLLPIIVAFSKRKENNT